MRRPGASTLSAGRSFYTHQVSLPDLTAAVRRFAEDRDWLKFHSPKNLAMALSVEVSELAEIFQWLSQAESRSLSARAREAAEEEIGDVVIYLVRLADELGVELEAAARAKLAKNEAKYPADRVRGSAVKYTDYG